MCPTEPWEAWIWQFSKSWNELSVSGSCACSPNHEVLVNAEQHQRDWSNGGKSVGRKGGGVLFPFSHFEPFVPHGNPARLLSGSFAENASPTIFVYIRFTNNGSDRLLVGSDATMICLDIPVPGCVQELLREPPVCFPREEDGRIVDCIKNLGTEFGRPEDEIKQACNLASGLSDLIIILERPRKGQKYDVAFDQFVRECPTLKAVDELIKFSTKGARSIHTVTLLDAFPFSPNESVSIPVERCHRLIEEILKLKRPKVVVCCWKGVCENLFISQFQSVGVGTWPLRSQLDIGISSTTLIRSFHPAAAICYRQRSPYTRLLLICHFVLAFAELTGSRTPPEWIKTVCDESAK